MTPPPGGANLIGRRESRLGSTGFTACDPRTGRETGVRFPEATFAEVDAAASLAAGAFETWRPAGARRRAVLLRLAADGLAAARDAIVAMADVETGLGAARLNGELDRTTGQLRAFAALVDEGSYVEAIISPADPAAQPPRPDVRRMLVPIGPVAVFTPCNFPLAFGVAGGDTASALAAGCPVIVKGHPSHPGTSELCARALLAAADAAGAPDGVLSLLQAADVAIGQRLVEAPEIAAVGFTGSLTGGRAIHDLAAARPVPIPVFAEMGSLNPIFITSAALAARAAAIADGLATSVTQGTGQFCTKPGLVFVPDTGAGRAFAQALAGKAGARAAGVMLNRGLHDSLTARLDRTVALPGVAPLTGATAEAAAGFSQPATVLSTTADAFLDTAALREEFFGPVTLVVFCAEARMGEVAARLDGTLTATIHAEDDGDDRVGLLADILAARTGRIVWNGFPTGVAVVAAMNHGGPYPATTCAAHTSVGTTAIRRFLRPVAWQNTPDDRLPDALRDANPLGIQRLLDGRWSTGAVSR